MQQRAPIQVRFVKIKLSVFVPAWGNGTGREHEIFCVSAETEHITWIFYFRHVEIGIYGQKGLLIVLGTSQYFLIPSQQTC